MEQKKKNTKLMIIIAVAVVVIVTIVGVVVFKSSNKEEQKQGTTQKTEELTAEEQFTVDYLVKFADAPMFNNRRSIKIHKVWFYEYSENYYYVAYNITYQNKDGIEVEGTFGNTLGVSKEKIEKGQTTIDDAYKSYLVLGTNVTSSSSNYYWDTSKLTAEKDGTQLDADKIQKAFEKAL